MASAPPCVRELEFMPGRKWRFDFAWPAVKLAVEIDGAMWGGRHTRGQGYLGDCEKLNEATVNGWRVLRFVRPHVMNGLALHMTLRALGCPRPAAFARVPLGG